MTKITKSEKLLREATSKWNKFLKEGAFKVQEARMGEYGKMDAEQGLPPTKIGRGNEEYMAAYNAVLQARGEEPMDIQKPDQAYLDALRSGQLEEQEDPKLAFPLSHNASEVKSLEQGYRKMKDFHNKFPSDKTDKVLSYFLNLMASIKRAEESLYVEEGQLEENEKKTFKVGEFVRVVGGSLKGATGKILEPVTTTTGEEGFAIELYSDADKKLFGQRGDEVIAVAGDLESGGTTDGMELYDIDEKLSAADKEFHKSVMDKGKVPNLKGDMGPIQGLEGPFQFRSGAVLYYDPKAGKYYDRGKDMYLDNDEAAELTMENVEGSDGLENARQLIASARKEIDKDLDFEYELKENNRIDWEDIVKSLSRAERLVLEHQDEMKGLKEGSLEEDASDQTYDMLDTVVDGLGGEKQALDSIVQALDVLTIQELLRKIIRSYGLNSELAEAGADRTTVSADPEMDQIEDIALSVIEKFGGLMGIASKLKDQGFDASVANGALSIDGKYFMGKADNFDISPDEDVRKVGKYVLGYMG